MINRPSPFGAAQQTPRRIILHAMAYQLDYEGRRMYAASFLERVRLSAHVLVAPDGTIIRCRDDLQGAWHAKGHNTDTLGMEILVPDAYNLTELKARTATPGWMSPAQFDAVVNQCRYWLRTHDIQRIERHSDVDPERRWFDPGKGFPWDEFLERVGQVKELA